MKRVAWLAAICVFWGTSVALAADQSASAKDTIAPGTAITMENWQQYKDFMPEGMVALFEGKYFWKMPPDIRIEIAPTELHPLPKNYLEATEKYSGQVKISEQPDGSLRLLNYMGGVPFPDPQEPHRGWKVLEDLWLRYSPNLLVDRHEPGCAIDSSGNLSCQIFDAVNRQLAYNTDKGVPTALPAPDAPFLTEWFMMLEPENQKYTTFLVISYADQSRPDDTYVFLPSLRRYQRVSSAARCAENSGMDFTYEDFHSGFDSNLTELQADYLTHKKMIALTDPVPTGKPFPEGYFMPLAWPMPSWAKWQVRDVDVIDVRKIPSKAQGYCYGKRIMYIDSHFHAPLWQEIYDSKMQPWKFYEVAPQKIDVPGIGPQNGAEGDLETVWNLKDNHATWGAENPETLQANENAPKEYQDLERYTTPAGLNLIMR
ncbi:MAG TPA: DUF1329 domain-containing protein [Candidatus Binataceae bacterium]|nr:DUF1329 domain-containing protein [Candidatus Binataceae bacterium]